MTIDRPAAGQIPALRQLWQQAFGDTDAFLDSFFSTGFSPDRCRCLWEEDQVAAALYWFDGEYRRKSVAYLYAVATAEAFRGQGLCHTLMENTHAHLAALGYAGTVLVPGSESLFHFYARMGYRVFSTVGEFSCTASGPAVPLQPISPKEYARLRKALLTENSVIQEGATLTFLQTQADFFAGNGILLAVSRNGGTAFIPELLGDPATAPGILKTLGAEKGTFRIPGNARPFAMYRSLTAAPPAKGYFGLALD